MPFAPETLNLNSSHYQRLGEGKESNQYCHRRYRDWRAAKKKAQRIKDERLIHDIYRTNKALSFKEYHHFLKSDNPLCVECLEENHITPGRVLDHKKPIEKGGKKYSDDNLQWLCDLCHNRKRSTTDKELGKTWSHV